jgi:hypothetical protein
MSPAPQPIRTPASLFGPSRPQPPDAPEKAGTTSLSLNTAVDTRLFLALGTRKRIVDLVNVAAGTLHASTVHVFPPGVSFDLGPLHPSGPRAMK